MDCFRKRTPESWIVQEGYLYIFLSLLLSFVIGALWGKFAAIPFLLLAIYFASFFRNPKRQIPKEAGLIVAPADGTILSVADCDESRYLKEKARRVSIFMSPFNCHMNRAPVSGRVQACFYKKGTFAAAFKEKAMEHNEHHAVLLKDEKGSRWLVVQIAGWLARRIVSYVREGDSLQKGERYGLIQFGSRTDLYCPLNVEVLVKPGEKVYAGKTILGRMI